jgi:hypothetical protein
LAFAHLALAAFRAIFRRSSGDKFFILALTDLRPIWAKYADSFLSITAPSYHAQRLSMKPATMADSPGCSIIYFNSTAGHQGHQFPFVETGAASFREVLAAPQRFPSGFLPPFRENPPATFSVDSGGTSDFEDDLRYLDTLHHRPGAKL